MFGLCEATDIPSPLLLNAFQCTDNPRFGQNSLAAHRCWKK